MNKNNFYGSEEDTEIPSTSNYMKFELGDNRFRILGSFKEGSAKQGIQYWEERNGKRFPVRIPKTQAVPAGKLGINKFGDPEIPQFFWAFPVWNYTEKKVQILSISQKTILRVIKSYIDNPKWGNPLEYDIIVTKSKNGDKTEYAVTVDPKEKMDEGIVQMYKDMHINMDAWFRSEDPFIQTVDPDEIPDDLS